MRLRESTAHNKWKDMDFLSWRKHLSVCNFSIRKKAASNKATWFTDGTLFNSPVYDTPSFFYCPTRSTFNKKRETPTCLHFHFIVSQKAFNSNKHNPGWTTFRTRENKHQDKQKSARFGFYYRKRAGIYIPFWEKKTVKKTNDLSLLNSNVQQLLNGHRCPSLADHDKYHLSRVKAKVEC